MRLIDADALMKVIREHDYPLRSHFNSTDNGMFTIGVQQAVDDAPTIDAVPVVRGEWVKSDDYKGWLVCSACHDCYVDNAWVNGKKWRYCPNCGAKMDGEKGESK